MAGLEIKAVADSIPEAIVQVRCVWLDSNFAEFIIFLICFTLVFSIELASQVKLEVRVCKTIAGLKTVLVEFCFLFRADRITHISDIVQFSLVLC